MPAPVQPSTDDATLEFNNKLSDPRRWVIKTSVPVFKAHERTDPNTGQLIKVDLPKLYRIANNMQRLERQGGVPIRCTLGHTEPGKPETEQPPVGGYYRNARVQPFGPKGEPAVVADEWLDPQYAPVRKNFPYRSAEYYDDSEQITGVALLTRDPYLDLGVVAYERHDPTFYNTLPANDRKTCLEFARQWQTDGVASYTANTSRPLHYDRNGRLPVMYQLVMGEQPQPVNYASTPQPQGRPVDNAQYSAPWPGPAYHPHQIGHHHQSGGAIYATPGAPTNYNPALAGAAMRGGAMALGSQAMGGMSGGTDNSRYANCAPGEQMPPHMQQRPPMRNAAYGRQPGRYAEEMGPGGPPPGGGGPGGPGGDPMQQLQMLLMAAVEVLGQMTGGGGAPPMGPGGPLGAPQAPFPGEEEEAMMASRYGRRPAPRGRGNYGRYENPQTPTVYTQPPAPVQQPQYPEDARTITGRPVGAALRESQLQYQLQRQNEAIKMLMYERDAADTAECVAEIQRLADQGFAVTEYEIGELKAKPRSQRAAYLQHVATHYQRIGTENLPPIMGDPTPAGPDPNAGRPATKEEMEAALKLSGANPQLNYNAALEQVRYGGIQNQGGPVNRIANMPYGATGPTDEYPQYGTFAAPSQNGHAAPGAY